MTLDPAESTIRELAEYERQLSFEEGVKFVLDVMASTDPSTYTLFKTKAGQIIGLPAVAGG